VKIQELEKCALTQRMIIVMHVRQAEGHFIF